jgi:ABC-type uncharacterized transport system involved in gliding motility auxiliary subunit
MVTECHRPEERTRVQSFNDFLVFGSMAVSSFASGQLLETVGWAAINEVVLPVVIVVFALMMWVRMRSRASLRNV